MATNGLEKIQMGQLNLKADPLGSIDSTVMKPPFSSIIFFAIVRPAPIESFSSLGFKV